jgi:predicted DNA-binding transcriptional regulator YafY
MQPPTIAQDGPFETATEFESHSPSLRLPLARLLQVLAIIQSERFPNARRLAEACAVSRRTIYRDLTTLELAGLPVLYRPDRQGYQLARECVLQPTQLDDKEALALLIMTRLGIAADPFGMLSAGRSAVAKVVQALPAAQKSRIMCCGELIADGGENLELAPDRQRIYATISNAVLQRKRLRLWYRERAAVATATTKLSPFRLAQVGGHWSLVGLSSSHREIRIFAVPWIQRAELTEEPYSIPPRFRLERFLRKTERNGLAPLLDVRLRFTAEVAPAVRDRPLRSDQRLSECASGALDLFLKMESFDAILPWILTFGDQVELLEPPQIRAAVNNWAERIARAHSESPMPNEAGGS